MAENGAAAGTGTGGTAGTGTGGTAGTGTGAPGGYQTSGMGSYASIISTIFEGVDNAIGLWWNISHMQADPCQAWIDLRQWDRDIYRPNYIRAISKARQLTIALEDHMEDVVRTRGASGGTGVSLERFLFQEFGGPLSAPNLLIPGPSASAPDQLTPTVIHCIARPYACEGIVLTAIRSHLPLASDIRNGTIPTTGEETLSPGVGLQDGRYTGSAIIAAVSEWLDEQRREAAPAAHPTARNKLITLVGTWEGSSPWGFWVPPENPEAIFMRVPAVSGMFEAAAAMVDEGELDLPPVGSVCAGIGSYSDTYRYLPEGGGGDGILPGSKVYEIVRFLLWTRNFASCMGAICFGEGGAEPIDLQPETIAIDLNMPNGGNGGNGEEEEEEASGINWLLVAGAAAAAWILM